MVSCSRDGGQSNKMACASFRQCGITPKIMELNQIWVAGGPWGQLLFFSTLTLVWPHITFPWGGNLKGGRNLKTIFKFPQEFENVFKFRGGGRFGNVTPGLKSLSIFHPCSVLALPTCLILRYGSLTSDLWQLECSSRQPDDRQDPGRAYIPDRSARWCSGGRTGQQRYLETTKAGVNICDVMRRTLAEITGRTVESRFDRPRNWVKMVKGLNVFHVSTALLYLA